MNELKVGAVAGVLCLLLPGLAWAQESPQALLEQDAVARAVAQNPTLHVALLRASQSRYTVQAEEAQYTPIFDASAGYTHSRSPSLFGTEGVRVSTSDIIDVGAGITKPFSFGTILSASLGAQRSLRSSSSDAAVLGGGAIGPGYSVVGQVAVSHPLLRGSGNDLGLAALRQARLSQSANELAAQQTASALLSQVVTAYWELWYAGEVVRINQASRELALTQQEQARQQVESGALAPASALPYATQVAQLDEAVLSSQTLVRQRELALAQLLGDERGVGGSFLAADAPVPPTADDPPLGSASDDALHSSYARKQLQAQLAIVKDQLKISGEALRPRLDVDAYVQAQGLGNRRVPPALEQFGRMEAVSAHVGLTFETPLTNTRRDAQVQSALLSQRMVERQIRELEIELKASVASAIAERRAARQRLELSAQTEKVALEQAEAERARFRAGGSIAISVQQAEDSLRQAQLRAQRARVDLVLADLRLAELRGQLLERYASALQRLPASERITLTRTHTNF